MSTKDTNKTTEQTNIGSGPEQSIPEQKADTSKVGGATKELSNEEKIAAKFSSYKNMGINELQSNTEFKKLAAEVLAAEVNKLPTAKFLKQSFEGAPSLAFYERFIEKVFSPMEFIPVGQGAEYCLVNGESVNEFDDTKWIPYERNDIDAVSNWTSITIPQAIKETQISVAEWKYINYFLTGKVSELAAQVVEEGRKAIARTQYQGCMDLIKTIITKIKTNTETPIADLNKDTATNNLKGDATVDTIDALNDIANIISDMEQDNKKYCYDTTSFTGYNNSNKSDLVIIAHPETINNLKKYSATFAAKDNLKDISNFSEWAMIPQRMKKADTTSPAAQNADLVKLQLGYDSGGNRIKGFVMIISKSGLKRLNNLAVRDVAYYPGNMTTQYFQRTRFTQDILPWTQCAIYTNSALENPFALPVINKTPTA